MDFKQAEKKFKQLKMQFEEGELTEAEFKAHLEELMVQDEEGTWWMIGYETELWYRHDGTEWMQTDPPDSPSQKPEPILPAELEAKESKNVEKTDLEKTERELSRDVFQQNETGSFFQKLKHKNRNWIIYGAIGSIVVILCITLIYLGGNFLFNQISTPQKEPAEVAPEELIDTTNEPAKSADEPTIEPEIKNPDTLVFATTGEPETLDPAWTYETAGSAIETNIYEGMVWFNREKTDDFVGVLATDWEVNDAGDVWTFNIRDGVTFHEGGTLEPHDVAYSVQRALLQDRIDGPHWMTLEAFFGLYAIEDLAVGNSGEDFANLSDTELVAACEKVKAAVVANDRAGTVTYNLAAPTPWFLVMMTHPFLGATYDMEWMIEQGAWDGSCDNWVNWHDPAAEETILFNLANGTGPYKLDYWTSGEEIVLTANENYWRANDDPIWEGGPSGNASVKTVIVKSVDEWDTRWAMFEVGDADYIYVSSSDYLQLEPDFGTVCQADGSCEEVGDGYIQAWVNLPRAVMTPAQFNWEIDDSDGNPFIGSGRLDGNGIPSDFFQDVHIRRAFNYCFDFDKMINDALNGEGIQAQGPIIAGMMGYREGEAPLYSYDPTMCEEEFKRAESNVWETGFYLQMTYNTGNDTRRLAAEILKAGIEGVNPNFSIAVVGLPWPALLSNRRDGKLPIYVGGWLEDFHDPHNWVHPFLHSQGAYSRSGVSNINADLAAKYDALIEEAASYTKIEDRRPIYEEIQLEAQEDAVDIWMYQSVLRVHFQRWVTGWYYNPAYPNAAYSYVYALP
jgi:peptide/nickel transport system substrate-binding protein